MPNITLEGPVIKNLAIKRRLAQKITEVATKAYAVPKEARDEKSALYSLYRVGKE